MSKAKAVSGGAAMNVYSVGDRLWVPHEEEAWLSGTVESSTGNMLEISTGLLRILSMRTYRPTTLARVRDQKITSFVSVIPCRTWHCPAPSKRSKLEVRNMRLSCQSKRREPC